MEHRTRFRIGLAAKLAICLVASTAAFSVIWGYIELRDLRRYSETQVLQTADRITDIIRRSTHYEMLHNDREALNNIIQEIGSQPTITRIRIFNQENRIQFSEDASEVGAKLAPPQRDRIFTDPQGNRLLGVIRPIENSPTCSEAACHSHPAGQRVLGVIEANLSLAGGDAEAAAQQKHLIVVTILAAILISFLGVIFIWLAIYRPVKELIVGTHRVAGGDLDYRLPVSSPLGSNDELGDLAASFNKMTGDLAAAHGEITDWARTLEERVERKTQQLESAHKTLLASEKMASIGKLAATVAHEVNNPLFGVLTYARLTLKKLVGCDIPDADKAEMAEHLQIIERESKRCGDIMRNLLTFARQAPSHRDRNDINTVIGRAVLLVRHKLELQQVELKQDLAADLPPVDCDGGQIQQVVLVLLVNAAEAMPAGGRIEIHTARESATGVVRIRVRDNGPGIPAEVLPKIFEPFFTTKEDQLRTGLGLAVAKSIVEQHGGEITVQSQAGAGTEFLVTLPGQQAGGDLQSRAGGLQNRAYQGAEELAGHTRPVRGE